MSDRLNELLRQRALMQEHLAWLEAEIAAAAPGAHPGQATRVEGLAPAPLPRPAPAPIVPMAQPAPVAVDPEISAEAAAEAEALLEEYRVAPDELKTDVRKGCLLYFFGALALLILGVIGLYFFFRHGK